jgi:hypothetical protein
MLDLAPNSIPSLNTAYYTVDVFSGRVEAVVRV